MNHTPPTRARGIAALLVSLVLSVAAVLAAGVGPASAHDQLLESSPAENAALDSAPTEITLTYSDSVLAIGAIVLLVDKNEKNWIDGEPVCDGPRVTVAVSSEPPDGAYEIRWRVVSTDGHPISGVTPFTIGDVAPAPSTSPPSSSNGEQSSTPDAVASSTVSGESIRTVLVGTGGAAAALLLFWAATAWNRHRRTNSSSRTPSP